MKPREMMPHVGEFQVPGRSGVIHGVMLVADVPDPTGQWWVGGRQVALVQWGPDRSGMSQPALYKRVNQLTKAAPTEGDLLKVLSEDPDLRVDYAPRGNA